jgi:hypothetical protein
MATVIVIVVVFLLFCAIRFDFGVGVLAAQIALSSRRLPSLDQVRLVVHRFHFTLVAWRV